MDGQHGERVNTIKYEDIASNPTKEISSLAKLMKIQLPNSAVKWIRTNMLQPKDEKGKTGPQNSSFETPYRTDKKHSKSMIKQWNDNDVTVGSLCEELIRRLGYPQSMTNDISQ